ncbi:disulfide bond formation protein [Rhodococcus sp. p52]|uniref:DsbA family protein n=1 Tax=Rhodococcus TaxID=1827 RepID=UPI00051A8A79|nr:MULTISPECIES: thioredoxin domain-containing protein [Rhodococcus]AOD24297.1 disulfide bond formation protein [Rhodococcus sp. p52]MCW3469133.1 DsbA family protein [Rhodococcus pyridinivorans]SED65539.1 Protein-disulfide isomerase [Rhodococcus pyridinivorans]
MTPTKHTVRTRRDLWLLGALGVVVAVLLAFLVVGRTGAEDAADPVTAPQMGPVGDMSRRIDGDPLAIGAVDAPVVLIEYSDYRCPFCAKFSRDVEPALIDKYVDEGILRMEWRDLPIFGDQSMAAARAGRAAAAQGKFWEFNATVYAASPDRGHPDLTPESLRSFAAAAGVPDLDRFDREAADPSVDQSIYADMLEANTIGVSSTPSFVINGTPILGAQPLGVFDQAIEAAAGAAE